MCKSSFSKAYNVAKFWQIFQECKRDVSDEKQTSNKVLLQGRGVPELFKEKVTIAF